MPIVSFLDQDIHTWIADREKPARSPGPHVSSVLVSMLKTAMPEKYAKYGTAVDGARVPVFELGYTWEDALATALQERLILAPGHLLMQPMELTTDGIHGTPDRVIYDRTRDRWIVEELKATWYSCKGLDADPGALLENLKFTYWLLQVRTYAAMLMCHAPAILSRTIWPLTATRYDLTPLTAPPVARIRALFVNGNYDYKAQTDQRARPMCWEIEWTPDELTDWWAAVVRHVATMETP
jgi:hypothetical protein